MTLQLHYVQLMRQTWSPVGKPGNCPTSLYVKQSFGTVYSLELCAAAAAPPPTTCRRRAGAVFVACSRHVVHQLLCCSISVMPFTMKLEHLHKQKERCGRVLRRPSIRKWNMAASKQSGFVDNFVKMTADAKISYGTSYKIWFIKRMVYSESFQQRVLL